ncbi:TPA: invasin, partial [Enterobacter cloacae subsp. cloacae]|nr:invasin [Enterobacter cloacae subsp. cloacae]
NEPVTVKDVAVNGYTFAKDAGFPTTGFKGAEFTLELNNASASNYTWTSDASWVSVNAGVVSFTGTGTADRVTITGMPKSGDTAITYSFTLSSWYIVDSDIRLSWSDAAAYCSAQSGYSLATVQQLNGSSRYSEGTRGTLGGLWSEWGNITTYAGAGFTRDFIWSSELKSGNYNYIVGLRNGATTGYSNSSTFHVICRQGL